MTLTVDRCRPRNYWDKTAWPKVRGQRLKQQPRDPRAPAEGVRPDCLTEPRTESEVCHYQVSNPDWTNMLSMTFTGL